MKATVEQVLALVPRTCPVCGELVNLSDDYAHLECTNPACSGKFARKLEIFAKALGMEYFGPANCMKMTRVISSFAEVFTMTFTDLLEAGFGDGTIAIILDNVNKVRGSVVPLDKFLTSLSIPMCGPTTSKRIAEAFKDLDTVRTLTTLDLVGGLENVQAGSAATLVEGLQGVSEDIDALLEHFSVGYKAGKVASDKLAGMQICITGTLSIDRKVWKGIIESHGGKLSSGVSKNTTYLICNKASTSSKYTKATALGTPIHTERWLADLLGM